MIVMMMNDNDSDDDDGHDDDGDDDDSDDDSDDDDGDDDDSDDDDSDDDVFILSFKSLSNFCPKLYQFYACGVGRLGMGV